MKKLLILGLLIGVCLFGFIGCNGDMVSITLPAEFFEDDVIDLEEDGVTVVVNDDGSRTVTMLSQCTMRL